MIDLDRNKGAANERERFSSLVLARVTLYITWNVTGIPNNTLFLPSRPYLIRVDIRAGKPPLVFPQPPGCPWAGGSNRSLRGKRWFFPGTERGCNARARERERSRAWLRGELGCLSRVPLPFRYRPMKRLAPVRFTIRVPVS